MNIAQAVALASLSSCACLAVAAPRDVKIASFDIDNAVVELTNFGTGTEDLSGWRFCSNNTSVVLRYSSSTGFNGTSLAPGESIFIHLNDDASGTGEINYSSLGGSVAPVDRTAYSIAIYFPPVGGGGISFGNGALIADFLQFSLNGANNTTANIRTDEAVNGGVWAGLTDWISTTNNSSSIDLVDTASVLSDSTDYAVNEPCLVDLAAPFGSLNFFDVAAYVNLFNAGDPAADFAAPFGLINFFDISAFIAQFNAGCP
ncbi:MAG: GC-type dockerin domain-anchored protein [Phycisphaerales bacterium]